MGSALSVVAVPLLAVETIHASGAGVGLVRSVQTLPFLLLAMPIGWLADRTSRRRLMLIADAVRAGLVAAVALTALLGGLTMAGLVLLAGAAGVFTVMYEVAYLSALPALIDDAGDLPRANRAVETAHASASLAGPGAGGVLVGVLTAAGVLVLDALSFVAGAVLTAVNRWPDPSADRPGEPVRVRFTAGWTWLRHDPTVRALTAYLAVNNLAAQAFQTALLLLVTKSLGLPAAAYGFTVAAYGGGFLLGAAVSPAAARRFGTGPVVIAAALTGAAGIAVVATSGVLALIIVGAAIAGAGPGMFNLHSIAVRQRLTPTALLGRVNALVKTVSYGASTLGALAGGLAEPRLVIAAAAGLSAVAAALLARSVVRHLARDI